jgi:sn-glycerol 3-phosphate transport system ATP-binding protein
VRVPIPAALRATAPQLLTLGVRPEHLATGERAGATVVRFQVENVEALGADSLLHGVFEGHPIVARVDGHATPSAGTAVAFSLAPERVHFFDSATGQRVRAAAS